MKSKFFLILPLLILTCVAPCFAENSPQPASQPTEKVAPPKTADQEKNKDTKYFTDEEIDQEKTTVQETHFGELLVRMLLILALTVVGLIIVSFLAKRFLYSRMQELNRSSRIQILEKRTLSPKSMLYIVKVDEEELAVSEHPNGVQLLKVLKHKDS